MSQFAAAIFDLDGTLIDTESRFLEAGLTALAEFGQVVEREFLISLIGIGPDEGFRRLCTHLGIALDRVAFETAWTEAAREALAGVIPLQPGVAELLAELNTRQMPRAVATNSGCDSAWHKLAMAGLGQLFEIEHVVGHDAVAEPKPAPDVYLTAAARLGVAPGDCVAFEDSETGVAAALAAGMVVVHVPDMAPARSAAAHHRAETILDGARACGLIR